MIWDRTPGRGAVVYQYDDAGRMIHQKDSSGISANLVFDNSGRVVESRDSLGNRTSRGYDVIGLLLWTCNALNDTIRYEYDKNGNQTALRDPDSHVTNFYYDAENRIVATVYPDLGVDSIYYDKSGRIIKKRDPKGVYTNFAYNDAGMLLSKTYSDSTSEDVFTYDRNGRMLSANNACAQLSWQYDNMGRPTHYQQIVNGITETISYDYNVAQRRVSITYPNGKVITRKMDLRDRLDSVVVNDSVVVVDYTYTGANMTGKRLGNGIYGSYSYDVSGKLIQLSYTGGSGILPSFSYGYDRAGNMKYMNKNHLPQNSETYGYDNTNQLVSYKNGTIGQDTVIHAPTYQQD
ncbi:MAG: RHS repeat protein [Candidatus Latescibacteria bacterium]|nr:RHS repeat protein [Candidatus Latescibacterota bacterium]